MESGKDIEGSYQGLIDLVKAHPELLGPDAPDPEMFKVRRLTDMKKKSKEAYGDDAVWDKEHGELHKDLFKACMAAMQTLDARGNSAAMM